MQRVRHDFFQACYWPSFIGSKSASAKKLFAKKITDFKSSASEALATYPVMKSFLQDALPNLEDNHAQLCCHSFFALCEVLDMLQMAGTGDIDAEANALERKICSHLELFKACYGTGKVLPKAHMNLHLGDFLRRHKCLLSCFVHERRHKELKRYANTLDNMQAGSEKHVLELELEKHLQNLESFAETRKGLIAPKDAPSVLQRTFMDFYQLPACLGLLFSNTCYVGNGRECKREDVVVLGFGGRQQVAQVWFHVCFAGLEYTCVSAWEPAGNNRFRISNEPVFVFTNDISALCIHKPEGELALVIPLRMPM